MDATERTEWTAFSLACPHCGNDGREDGEWTLHSRRPFKIVEDVVRSFEFRPELDADGKLFLSADTETDSVDWESGRNTRLECMACFGDFPIPDGVDYDFF